MRTLGFTINGFSASMTLPDGYFTEAGIPRWNRLNSEFASPNIIWNRVIGGVQVDEKVVNPKPEYLQQPDVIALPTSTPIGEELKQIRQAVASLEQKLDGVR